MIKRFALAAIAAACLAGCIPFQDANDDGHAVLVCHGDSLTKPDPSWGTVSWCDLLQQMIAVSGIAIKDRDPAPGSIIPNGNIRTVNRAAGYGTAIDHGNFFDARDQLFGAPDGMYGLPNAHEYFPGSIATDAPDAAVLAFGGADVRLDLANGAPHSVSEIVEAYRALKQTLETAVPGIAVFIATTPYQYDVFAGEYVLNPVIDELNAAVRAAFPPNVVIEFAGAATYPGHYLSDGLHLNTPGQLERAKLAYHKLFDRQPPDITIE